MWSIGVIFTFVDDLKTFLTLLAIAGNVLYQTQLNSASSSWSCLICCFCSSFIPTVNRLCINPDILQRWCNEPVCRHSWCQCWCWWRCRCCVGFNLFFMSSHHCYWTMQTQSDSGCVDLEKNMRSCVAYLWLPQPFGPMCKWLALIWNDNMSFFQQQLLMYRGIQYAYHLGNLKPRKLFAFL